MPMMMGWMAAAAQTRPAVMILATYHMANPGLDLVKVEIRDTLSPVRQREIADVVDRLAAFRPTVVAVEEVPEKSTIAARVERFRNDGYTLTASESDQIALRLARRDPKLRVVPFDHPAPFPFEAIFRDAQAAGQTSVLSGFQAMTEGIGRRTAEVDARHTVAEILAMMNEPSYLEFTQRAYVGLVGVADGRAGADLLGHWYGRNIQMFRHLRQALKRPDDRMLVIVGASHAPILRQLVRDSGAVDLVEAGDYLPKAPASWVTSELAQAADRMVPIGN